MYQDRGSIAEAQIDFHAEVVSLMNAGHLKYRQIETIVNESIATGSDNM